MLTTSFPFGSAISKRPRVVADVDPLDVNARPIFDGERDVDGVGRQIAVATMVMPSATATGTMLFAELHVSNCTGNFTSSVNHRSCRIMLPTTYDGSDWLTKICRNTC